MGNERPNGRLLLGIIGVYFWGLSGFSGFLEFLFLLLGGFGAPWVGGPRRGFRQYLMKTDLRGHTLFAALEKMLGVKH